MSFEVGSGGGGGGIAPISGGSWTPVISNVRPNSYSSDSGTVQVFGATWQKDGAFVDITLRWRYAPIVPNLYLILLNFEFTFPPGFVVQDFYGENYVFYTENGPTVGAGGGGVLGARVGEIAPPFSGALANTGIGPYPTQVRSASAVYGKTTGTLNL